MADDAVAQPTPTYLSMAAHWKLPLTLWGGTIGMRAAGEDFLPRNLKESKQAYERRVNRSFLFNGFKKTIQSLTGKVFSKELVLQEDVPAPIKGWSENVDLTGRHINIFARDVFESGAKTGMGHILVDMQRNDARNLAEERAAGVRPYIRFIPAEAMIGWRTAIVNGTPVLTQIRFIDNSMEADGEFGEVQKQRVRAS